MDLKCYVFQGWEPRIIPAPAQRDWMDSAPESFPYRCLPLAIANSHGWQVLTPFGFEVEWNGGPAAEDVIVRPDANVLPHEVPVPLFGLGTFTIHIQGLFRTPPGWNIFVSGPPNAAKDGIAPLAGIIETDWPPYTFTMNWRMTRPGHVARFEADEPIAHFFPIQRNVIENVAPRFVPIDEEPELKAQFEAWSASRDAFQQHVRDHPPAKPADKWQKFYYRGLMPDGHCPVADHQSKLRVAEFANAGIIHHAPRPPAAAPAPRPAVAAPAPRPAVADDAAWTIAKYEWILKTQERQRALSTQASGIFRVSDVSGSGEEFLDHFYAPGRPAILCGAIDHWPALAKWTPDYLRATLGTVPVECQAGRSGNARFELDKDAHRTTMPFDRFLDRALANSGNDLYITAYNNAANTAALAPLDADVGEVDDILAADARGMIWIGPEGTFTPQHHDLTNNLLVQITGRKRVVLAAPGETPKLYNALHVFSQIPDLTAADIDFTAFPRFRDVRLLDVTLAPGEALFIPVGWWHQVRALDFSVSMTFTGFRWPNDNWQDHPRRA